MRRPPAVLGLLLIGVALPLPPAFAHVGHVILRAERYLKLDVSGHEVRMVVSLTLGPAEGRRVLEAADSNGDGEVSRAESESYLAAWADGLRQELPLSLNGELLELVWGEGYFEPSGAVRHTPLTVEMVARFELSGGDETVRFVDRMVRREVFERTDVAFQVRGGAELSSSGVEGDVDGPTPELAYPGAFREGEDVVLVAALHTPERSDGVDVGWRWLTMAGAGALALMIGLLGWRRRRALGSGETSSSEAMLDDTRPASVAITQSFQPASDPERPDFTPLLDFESTEVGSRTARLERRVLGSIELGVRVVACDPLVPMDVEPFVRRLRPGRYEVAVYVVTEPIHVVAAELILSREATVSWELALREGRSDSGSYGVDSGTGGFMAERVANELELGEDLHAAVGDRAMRMLEEAPHGGIVALDSVTVAVFRSGLGDGAYDSWWGLDADGTPTRLVTDFELATAPAESR